MVFHYVYACITFFFSYSSTDGNLGWSLILAHVSNAAISKGMQKAHQHTDFFFFGYIPSMRWLAHTVVLFLIVEDPPYCFSHGCTNLIPANTVQGFPSLCIPWQLFFVLLVTAILTGVEWYFFVVLICFYKIFWLTEHLDFLIWLGNYQYFHFEILKYS